MARVKRGTTTHARHAKVIKAAKGYYGRRKNTFRTATQAVDKARQYAYRDRRVRKREFRALWIQRINAAARLYGVTLSLIHISEPTRQAEISYAVFCLKKTSRRDLSGQINHGQNQSFFLAPVNTTARLSSRILG